MELSLNWSPEAIEDLHAITDYISRDSNYYASSVVSKILSTAKKIAAHPQIGRMVPELADEEIRERFVYSYRVVYKVQISTVTILAIIHGKRLIENINPRFE